MAVAATGFFDGVHLGHRQVIDRMTSIARSVAEESVIITFWPHPRSVLQMDADKLRLLTTLDEKKARCLACGADRFEVVPFSRDFSRLSAAQFVKEYLVGRYGVSTLVIGYDHRLGHDSFSSPEEMARVVEGCGVRAVMADEYRQGGTAVSSTIIRNAVSEGNVQLAEMMLGYRYSLTGVVVAGNRLGRTIGFPTANMQLYEPLKLIPGNGVYAVYAHTLGHRYKGICNIGVRPTVGSGNSRTVETHLLDFNQDIYGLDIKVEFVSRLRDEMKFSCLDQLKSQLVKDREKALVNCFDE
ncbi:MAG: riboflavin biosynthesis protein RibF [Bacteroidales bacterium]|nr:riboflavin biosynthesis protein RibF [Candidatus Cacconaster merdequi]